MKAIILIARNGSSFHFGEYAPFGETFLDYTSSFPHSDTLFSALVNIHSQVWPEVTGEFIDLFRSGQVRISSAMFCFRGKDKTLFFLPRPSMMKLNSESDRKKLKNIEWISTGIWQKGMEPKDMIIAGKHFACLKSEWNELTSYAPEHFSAYKLNTVPRVMIHSQTREDTLYQQTNITLSGSPDINVSYYFLADYESLDKPSRDKLESIISLLPDTGLGGQRTTGCGFFEGIEWIGSPLPEVKGETRYVNLGLMAPGEDLSECIAYRLITRGGRRTEKGQLKKIMMIREGALMNKDCRGSIEDISAEGDGKSLRYGMPLSHFINRSIINL